MSETTKRVVLWGGTILGLFLFVVLLAKLGAGGSSGVLTDDVGPDDHTQGTQGAAVVLIEYSDFQCPACKATYPIVKKIAEEYQDKILFSYRDFPLEQIHAQAFLAAQAAEAAGMQGKFWDMHDVLFNTQATWSGIGAAEDFFVALADSIGLNQEQFKADLYSDSVKKKVQDDIESGNASGVNATPAFFLNGTQITHPGSYDGFKKIIDDALANS